MNNSEPLVLFGIVVVIVLGLFVAIPFLRRKSDLLSAWNTLLVGLIIYAGLGSIEVKYNPSLAWEHLNWFQPKVKEINWYMLATGVFIVTLLAAYYLNSYAKRFAQRRFQKWPELSTPLTIFVIGFCFLVIALSMVFKSVTFLGPLTFNLATIGAPAACVFSFALWNRNRVNLLWLFLFLGVFVTVAIYSMVVSGGRRLLLSTFLGPVLYLYWTSIRYWRPSRVIVATAIASTLVLSVGVFYSSFRWYNLAGKETRSVSGIIEKMREHSAKGDLFSGFMRNWLEHLAQSNAHFALLTQRYVEVHALTPEPLNSLAFLVAYPIPRDVWEGKPEVIGLKITRDVAHVGTNWGLGVSGQGAFEGGVLALMLYAVLLAFFMRIIDEPLRLQPSNPFLIYMLAAAMPHIAGIPRGDMGIMTKEAIQCVLFAVILGYACRIIFGTRKLAPTPSSQATWQYALPGTRRLANSRRAQS